MCILQRLCVYVCRLVVLCLFCTQLCLRTCRSYFASSVCRLGNDRGLRNGVVVAGLVASGATNSLGRNPARHRLVGHGVDVELGNFRLLLAPGAGLDLDLGRDLQLLEGSGRLL